MIGAVLAGGAARRMGGTKPAAELGKRPLISYPVAAMSEVCERVAVVCKASTPLPDLEGVERWDEPAEPTHPLAGIVHALERAGEPVLVCAADMPFVTADALRTIVHAGQRAAGTPAVVAVADGMLQPLLALYAPACLERFRTAEAAARLTDTVEALGPVRVALPGRLVTSVDTPDQLSAAEAELSGRSAPRP
ncbi:MAG TPA: molybdenum cofactor guanylyltransferase [Thermoleophilaceae bacterium]